MSDVISEKDKIESLLQDIQHQCDSSDLKLKLNKCNTKVLQEWHDDNSFDILHHCILNNNMMAVVLLLSRGLFKPPYEPSTWPYLHLLSCLGHRTLMTTIIQELGYQNLSLLLKWNVFVSTIKPKMAPSIDNFKDEDKSKKLTPIDLASLFGHFSCVQLLLDFWQFRNTVNKSRNTKMSSLYLSLACQANSPSALRLMLQEHKDKKEALQFAIRMSSAECVDVVLRDKNSKLDIKTAFQGMNLFHVLYSYSRCMSKQQLEDMVAVTSVLIFHEQNVNSCRPSRTFPLYSLLNKRVVGVAVDDIIPSLTSALLLLLKTGADPNVDEILIEKHVRDKEYTTAFGRKPFSSGVNCLINSVTMIRGRGHLENNDDRQQIEKYSYNCLELLLKHGADLSYVGKFYEISIDSETPTDDCHIGTALHMFFSTRIYHVPSYPFLRLLLHYGIDTDIEGNWQTQSMDHPIKYALNILPFAVWTTFINLSRSESQVGLNDEDFKLFVYTMKFMSPTSLYRAFVEFNESVDGLRNKVTSQEIKDDLETKHLSANKIFSKMIEAFTNEIGQPWPLQRCCSHVVWRSCGMHMGNVFSLNIPNALRNIIMLFH